MEVAGFALPFGLHSCFGSLSSLCAFIAIVEVVGAPFAHLPPQQMKGKEKRFEQRVYRVYGLGSPVSITASRADC